MTITLTQFVTSMLHWIQFSHSQTISITSLELVCIICVNYALSATLCSLHNQYSNPCTDLY